MPIDPLFRVAVVTKTPNPQQCAWIAMHQDYCENFALDEGAPDETKAGQICVKRLLAGERGHYGPLEHQQIVFNVGWFPHAVMQQARTHRVGCCLSGDTEVFFGHKSLSNGCVYYKKTIKELATLWHHGRSHQRGLNDAAYMRRMISSRRLLQINEGTGQVAPTSIRNIFANGEKTVYRYTLDNGFSVKATRCHKVFTPNGWTTFGQLSIGTEVMVGKFCPGVPVDRKIPEPSTEELEKEEWMVVADFPWYSVSTLGRVRSVAPKKHRGVLHHPKAPRLKTQSKGKYLFCSLSSEDSSNVRVNIHSLVLSAFIGRRPQGQVCRHINGNAYDNRLENLEWGSEEENAKDRVSHDVIQKARANPARLLSEELIGVEETYDLEVEGPFHNFLANGIVVHNSFDVQSGRYTGQRFIDAANGTRSIEEVFYLRPIGFYSDREGKKYEYTSKQRERDLQRCMDAAAEYAMKINIDGMAEEQARGIIPFDFRQHFVVSFTTRALMHFLDLRAKKDAQDEIRHLCDMLMPHFRDWMPEIAEWYGANRYGKARLAP